MNYTLRGLSPQDMELIGVALGNLPYLRVVSLLQRIQQQVDEGEAMASMQQADSVGGAPVGDKGVSK